MFHFASYPLPLRFHVACQDQPLATCLSLSGRKVLQQLLRCLVQVFPVLLLVFAEVNLLNRKASPNKLFGSSVIDTEDEYSVVYGRTGCGTTRRTHATSES